MNKKRQTAPPCYLSEYNIQYLIQCKTQEQSYEKKM